MKLVEELNPRLLMLGLSLLVGTATALAQAITSLEGSYILPAGDPAIATVNSDKEMPSHVFSSNSQRVRSGSPTTVRPAIYQRC